MKKALIALAIALIVPVQSNAQFFKKLGKVLEEVGSTAVEVLSNSQDDSDSAKKQSKKSKTKTNTKTSVAQSSVTDNVQRTFTVQATDYKAFAMLKSDDVNIRKSADANSGKLMMWSSDDGSCETVTKYFFSDENRGRYRSNANTGATLEALHFPQGTMLPFFGDDNGWLAIDLSGFAPEIGGAFIMSKFCDQITVGTLGSELVCPIVSAYDNNPTTLQKIYCRTTGKFTDLPFAIFYDENEGSYGDYGAQVLMLFPIKVTDQYLFIKQLYITVDFGNVSTPSFAWKKDVGMDEEVFEELHLNMKQVPVNQIESSVASILLGMNETAFTKLIDKIFTYNAVEYGFNYFKGEDGNYYSAGEAIQSPFFVNKTRTVTIGTGKKYTE